MVSIKRSGTFPMWVWSFKAVGAAAALLVVALHGASAQSVIFKGESFNIGPSFDYTSQPGYDSRSGMASFFSGTSQLVSSNFGPNIFSGLNINNYLGAQRFYNAGYTGASATLANIEAGFVAGSGLGLGGANSPGYTGGHDTLEHVGVYFRSASNPLAGATLVDRHATWVGHTMNGRVNTANYPVGTVPDQAALMRGIAHGANLWSGAVATSWNGAAYRLGFNFNYSAFIDPYREALINDQSLTDVNLAARARVSNSSWGFTDPTGSAFGNFSRGVDGLVRASGTSGSAGVMVFSAGNSGPGANTVGGPASGYNVVSVGALGADSGAVPYNTVSSFSSRGPMSVFVPAVANVTDINNAAQGTILAAARGRVDISAPGQNLTLAYYGGATGGNQAPSEAGSPNGNADVFSSNVAGTSFAAPTVAGGFALMADAGNARLPGVEGAQDARVLKAAMLNAADKTAGWTNNATGAGTTASPYNTTRGLDYTVGAGRMNLDRAFDQYLGGTTGVAGNGGTVGVRGWDYGFVNQAGSTATYYFSDALLGGSSFVATLSWFVNRSIDAANNTLEQRFDDLDLQVFKVASVGGPIIVGNLVASSTSAFDTIEHANFTIPDTGLYALRVLWAGTRWNFTATTGENFGLAWSAVAVPEPGAVVMWLVGLTLIGCALRRRRPAAAGLLPGRPPGDAAQMRF